MSWLIIPPFCPVDLALLCFGFFCLAFLFGMAVRSLTPVLSTHVPAARGAKTAPFDRLRMKGCGAIPNSQFPNLKSQISNHR